MTTGVAQNKGCVLGYYLPFFVNFTHKNVKFANKKEVPTPAFPRTATGGIACINQNVFFYKH